MSQTYSFYEGGVPLLVSVPHDGRQLPADIVSRMTDAGRSIPDTDWHVERLYEFSRRLGTYTIIANYSRYVVDLNRPADDEILYEGQLATGLCPSQTFAGDDIYVGGAQIDAAERVDRIETYWRPYHRKIESTLAAIREKFGYALLWDAHSIPSNVPRLFDGELPVLNFGTWDGRSCDDAIASAVFGVAAESSLDAVLNARFKGGYITRHYGRPEYRIHAIQLEIAQRAYMDEASLQLDEKKLSLLRDRLEEMLTAYIRTAAQRMQ